MAWTQADLDAIEEAIASGEKTVQFQDRSVTYRNLDELFRARDAIKASLGSAGGDLPQPRQVRLQTRSGW